MDPLERVARNAASEAAQLLKAAWQGEKRVEHKSEVELVTDIDRKVEALIVGRIRREFPDHSIMAEESELVRGASDWIWYVDPLDGTTNFAHSYPQFAISIAAAKEKTTRLGLVYDPLREEVFTARMGGGSRLNDQPVTVSSTEELDASLLATGFPYDRRRDPDFYLTFFGAFLVKSQGIRRSGSAALDLCHLACGRLDGFWEWKLHPWDTAAGALVVREAGGQVTDFSGGVFDFEKDETLASNGTVHREMIKVLQDVMQLLKQRD